MPLPEGGLARAALHEVLATVPGCGAAFCAVLLARTGGTVLWIAAAGRDELLAWPPGLARCGLAPADLVLVQAERPADALWAMEESLRCPAVAGVLLASSRAYGEMDLTATRRLQLAAEAGGALGLLLRPEGDARQQSAAATRWRVSPAPSGPAGCGLGDPRWRLELLRARGGRPGGPWTVTWRAASGRLDLGGEEAAATGASRSGACG